MFGRDFILLRFKSGCLCGFWLEDHMLHRYKWIEINLCHKRKEGSNGSSSSSTNQVVISQKRNKNFFIGRIAIYIFL